MAECMSCDGVVGSKNKPCLCEHCHDGIVADVQGEYLEEKKRDAFTALLDELRARWLPNHSNHSVGGYVSREA